MEPEQYDVTFTFEGTQAEVDLVVNRIIENHEPIAFTQPRLVPPEERIERDQDEEEEADDESPDA